MKCQLTVLAAMLSAAFACSAQSIDVFPNDQQSYANQSEVVFNGDGSTDAIINKDTVGIEYGLQATAANVSIKGYRDFIIADSSNSTWGLFIAYNSQVDIEVERNISITASDIGVHLMNSDGSNSAEFNLNAGGNIAINTEGNGIWAQNRGEVNLTSKTGSIVITTAGTSMGTMEIKEDKEVNIALNAAQEINITRTTDGKAISLADSGGNLSFTAPAGVNITGDVSASSGKVTFGENTSDISIKNGSYAHFGELSGRSGLNFHFDKFAEGEDTFTVANNKDTVVNTYMGHEGIDELSAEEETEALKGLYANGERVGNGTNYTVTIDKDAGVSVEGSDITKMTNDLAAMSLVAWRNEITSLNDRMSTLRSNPATIGVWARYNGGEYQYHERNLKNQFNTVEIGADAQIAADWIIGGSFSYTKGDGSLEQGQTETNTYSGALYALWTHEHGTFLDVVAKVGHMENDFDFYNQTGGAFDNGTLDHTGFIFGMEAGHRIQLPMNAFVEPQVQLTYSRLSSVSETTTARQVELDAIESLVGRVGIMAGVQYPNNRGAAYIKISGLHDFRGDIDGTYSSVNGNGAFTLSQEIDDSWIELACGGNFQLTDNATIFADVAKSAGGDIDLEWRANVGAKLFF